MTLKPASREELVQLLAECHAAKKKVDPVDLSAFARLVEYTPEDMTASVESGMLLSEFQDNLASNKQWLPLDPPFPERTTIAALVDQNLSGPRRLGYGSLRDYVIGIKVATPEGKLIKAGGKVVKNVAGYDLGKLFIGAQQTLGIVVEVTFKLRPLPESEVILKKELTSLIEASELIARLRGSSMAPVVCDLHRGTNEKLWVTLSFAGNSAEVDAQKKSAAAFGFNQSGSLDYERYFWENARTVRRVSVLPSRLTEVLGQLKGPFVARAQNGIVYHQESLVMPNPSGPEVLQRRLKAVFDPNGVLPEFPL